MWRNPQKQGEKVAGVEGLEPPTLGLEIRCSILLSYTPNFTLNILSRRGLLGIVFPARIHLKLR